MAQFMAQFMAQVPEWFAIGAANFAADGALD